MIKKPTAFVLGAGASQAYGFPLGAELVDQICDRIEHGNASVNTLAILTSAAGCSAEDVIDFVRQLREARRYSIDRFLEMEPRPDRVRIGKLAIADTLLFAELNSNLNNVHVEHDWLRYLFDQLIRKHTGYFEEQAKLLSIVTFNFDRSFEYALFRALRTNYRLSDAETIVLTQRVRIVHVHGDLGEPFWLKPDSPLAVPFGGAQPDKWIHYVQAAAERIILSHEPNRPTRNVDIAVELLRNSDRVCFLGFGYDEDNLNKLGVPTTLESASEVRGTTVGKEAAERKVIDRRFANRILLQQWNIRTFLAENDVIHD